MKKILLLLGILIFFFVLRWNHFTAPYERDEGAYAFSAWNWRQGNIPYENTFPNKPPMIIYTYLAGQILFGDHIASPRILAAIFSLLTIFLVGLIAKHEFGVKAGWIAAWFLTIMLILPVNFGKSSVLADVYYAANAEIFMILPVVLFLYLYVVKKEKANHWIWFLSGVISAIAILYKPICLLILAFIYVYWIKDLWKEIENKSVIFVNLFFAILGGLLAPVVIFLPFLISDGGREVFTQLIGFNICYSGQSQWNFGISQFFHRLIIMSPYYWALFLLFGYYLFKRPSKWFFYSGLLTVSFISIYQSLIGHYFLQIMPFLAIISAQAVTLLVEEKLMKKVNLLLFTVLLLLTIIYPIRAMFTMTPEELSLWVYGRWDQFYEAKLVGEKVAAITKPDDLVYVEGADSQIYYFARRKTPVKLEVPLILTMSCSMLTKYKEQYPKDLKKNPPKVIITCVSGSCKYLWYDSIAKPFMDSLSKMIKDNYKPVGAWMVDHSPGYWLEPITEADIKNARTVVYLEK